LGSKIGGRGLISASISASLFAVLKLTRSAGIKLNEQVSLRRHRHRLRKSPPDAPHTPQVRSQGQSRQAIIFRLAALFCPNGARRPLAQIQMPRGGDSRKNGEEEKRADQRGNDITHIAGSRTDLHSAWPDHQPAQCRRETAFGGLFVYVIRFNY
jgi:hypothetical protein